MPVYRTMKDCSEQLKCQQKKLLDLLTGPQRRAETRNAPRSWIRICRLCQSWSIYIWCFPYSEAFQADGQEQKEKSIQARLVNMCRRAVRKPHCQHGMRAKWRSRWRKQPHHGPRKASWARPGGASLCRRTTEKVLLSCDISRWTWVSNSVWAGIFGGLRNAEQEERKKKEETLIFLSASTPVEVVLEMICFLGPVTVHLWVFMFTDNL